MEEKIEELYEAIQDHEEILIGTCNPMKIKRRKKAIKKLRAEIEELKYG